MPIKIKIYLLTILLVFSAVGATFVLQIYQTWEDLKESEYVATLSLAKILDQTITEDYDTLLTDTQQKLPKKEKIHLLNTLLQPVIQRLHLAFPEYGIGFYVRDLNSIVAFAPDFNTKGLKDISSQSKARTVYHTGVPLRFNSYSQTRDALVVATIYPVVRHGKIIGHVWANVAVKDLEKIFKERLTEQLLILLTILAVAIFGTNFITNKYIESIRLFREHVRRLDLNTQDSARFTPELIEVYTEVAEAYSKLATSEKRFRDVANAFDEFVWEIDTEGRYTFLSNKVSEMLGYTPSELLDTFVFDMIYPEHVGYVKREFFAAVQAKRAFINLEFQRLTKNQFFVWQRTSGLPVFDQHNELIGYRGATRDISERKRYEEEIRHLAYYDILTELPNRTTFNRLLHQAIETAQQEHDMTFAIFFVDLDRFKNVNDSLGHDVGDSLLQKVALHLKLHFPATCTVSRFGGDEFIVLLPTPELTKQAASIASKIIHTFTDPIHVQNHVLHLSASIGIACFPQDGHDPVTLIKNADIAMYYAKANGKNQFCFFSHELKQQASEKLELENNLRYALDNQQFILYYQPQVHLGKKQIVSVEALLRWRHPTHGMIMPNTFIPLAEETQLIIPIGLWVMRQACLDFQKWNQLGFVLERVAVNVSSIQFRQPHFVEQVKNILLETKMPPACLELEITESVTVDNINYAIDVMDELRRLGISISIDDFGTGFSSLNYLKNFPINTLKVDRSFIINIEEQTNDLAIIRSIIALAHSLHLNVIAEGVENYHQLCYLSQQKCDMIQGYYFSKPLNEEDLIALLCHPEALPNFPD